jgi:hypothetical protein
MIPLEEQSPCQLPQRIHCSLFTMSTRPREFRSPFHSIILHDHILDRVAVGITICVLSYLGQEFLSAARALADDKDTILDFGSHQLQTLRDGGRYVAGVFVGPLFDGTVRHSEGQASGTALNQEYINTFANESVSRIIPRQLRELLAFATEIILDRQHYRTHSC